MKLYTENTDTDFLTFARSLILDEMCEEIDNQTDEDLTEQFNEESKNEK